MMTHLPHPYSEGTTTTARLEQFYGIHRDTLSFRNALILSEKHIMFMAEFLSGYGLHGSRDVAQRMVNLAREDMRCAVCKRIIHEAELCEDCATDPYPCDGRGGWFARDSRAV